MKTKSILLALTVAFFADRPLRANMSAARHSAKAYAVFVASYDEAGSNAVGGVAGTAFFVSDREAVTAYHVLQASSFNPSGGFHRSRVWLVHEDEAPIEIKPAQLDLNPGRDLTVIRFADRQPVKREYIYERRHEAVRAGEVIETEGFVASSTGPKLARNGADLDIIAVPRLQRLSASGEFVRDTDVTLAARDVNLRGINCFELSYLPVRGLSGGPVTVNGEVIAMNSFADPRDGQRTWAVRLN